MNNGVYTDTNNWLPMNKKSIRLCHTLLVQKPILLLRESTGMPISVASVFEVQLKRFDDLSWMST
jgi:hypothetical protein